MVAMAGKTAVEDSNTSAKENNAFRRGPDPNRVRDNQRRSRAQRKAFVESLQRKVEEYERRGVEATVQMQQAARAVSAENARLRMLLAQRGVSENEVKAFLESFDDGEHGQQQQQPGSASRTPPPSSCCRATAETDNGNGCLQRPTTSSSLSAGPIPMPVSPSETSMDRLSVLADASTRGQMSSSAESVSTTTMPTSMPTSLSPPPSSASPSPLEMSCNAAARIIADMHGHGDDQLARTSLGCGSNRQDCVVKNVVVFSALDQ